MEGKALVFDSFCFSTSSFRIPFDICPSNRRCPIYLHVVLKEYNFSMDIERGGQNDLAREPRSMSGEVVLDNPVEQPQMREGVDRVSQGTRLASAFSRLGDFIRAVHPKKSGRQT